MAKRKPPANDHFQNQMIGVAGHADADAKIKLPIRRNIEVDGRKNLMLLFALRIKTAQRAQRPILFDSGVNLLCDCVSDLKIRGELEASFRTRPLQGALECGIERQIPTLDLLIDDRANFPTPGVFGKPTPLIADLV